MNVIMYDYSKALLKKIVDTGILEHREILFVERALRLQEINDLILNQQIELNVESNPFEIEYSISKQKSV